jgi:PAS domain S-box-containing protein
MSSAGQQPDSLNIQLLVDSIPALIHTARPDGYLDYFNKPWLEYLGATLEQVSGWNWTAFINPEDVDGIVAQWRACLVSGEIFEYETRVRRANGEYRWMFHRKVPVRDANGNIVRWYGSSLDIEDRKQAEALLSAEKRLLEMTATDVTLERILNVLCLFIEEQRSGTLASVLLLNPDGVYLRFAAGPSIPNEWKQQMERLPIGPCAGSCGTAAFTRSPVIVSDIATDPLWKVPEHRASALKHGLRASWSSPVLSSKGKVLGTFCMYYREPRSPEAQDLDLIKSATHLVGVAIERDRAKQALRRSEAYLAEAQRLSHTGSFGWKPSSGEIVWSDETYRIFEYDRAEKPTLNMVFQRIHPQDRTLAQRVIDGVSRSTDFENEYRLVMPSGAIKHIQVRGHSFTDSSGDIEVVGAVTDITERKTAEDKIRCLVEAGILGIFIANVEDKIVEANQAFLQMLQYGRQDLVSGRLRWTDLTPAELRERDQRALTEALANGVFQPYEKEFLRKDGSRLPVLIGGALFQSANEGVVFVLDLSEQKRAEQERRRGEIELRQIVDLVPQLIAVYGPNRERLHANRTALDYLGISLDEWQHKSFGASAHPDDSERLKSHADRALSSGADDELELRLRKRDGSYRWFLARLNPLLDEHGQVIRWYFTGTDIDDRKQAEDRLREENVALKRAEGKIRGQEMELRQIIDFAPWQVSVLGADGKAMYLNKAGLDYHGLTPEAFQDYDPRRDFHPDDRDRIVTSAGRAKLPSDRPYEIEARLAGKDGKYRWFLFQFNPLRNGEGRVTRWYVTATDIEDRKQTEERLQRENVALREEIDKTLMFEEIVGASAALQVVLARVSKVAPSDSTVLISGETGTGKELVARAIHRCSNRALGPFVSVNCAAVPRDLIASELFGHEKGAFTGATQQRQGRFELASGGTIFLDEVGELPAETQIALLRVLQEREFERVGGIRRIHADVRIIAATNRDLQTAIRAGAFRRDLFYRLHVFPIVIPPLRERQEDISLLVEYFIHRYARKAGKNIRGVSKKTLELLQSYPWPGNIRELQNVIERSVILCDTEIFSIDESWLPREPLVAESKDQIELSERLLAQEKNLIEAALKECRGRVFGPDGAAGRLGIPRSTLESKIRSLKIDKYKFKIGD